MKKLLIILVLVLFVAVAGCASREDGVLEDFGHGYDVHYRIEYHEGMPCLVTWYGDWFGITCDWSQWEGNK